MDKNTNIATCQNTVEVEDVEVSFDKDLIEADESLAKCCGIDIREINILRLQELFASGQMTSVALTKCYLERIQRMNPILKCVVEVNPDAVSEATRADLERSQGKGRGDMHGIPILIKENIATDDQMETTAGSLALVGVRPKSDAEVVGLLRKAGAILLGKANTSEFAYWRGTNIPDGWSGRGGQTKNAYNLKETPEGSSAGSAVSVSTNLATVSIGTETDGSLIAPSSLAGIFTIKSTMGLISTKGVIPISHNQDTVGPMARNVTDLAILLDAMIPLYEKHRLDGGGFAKCLTKKNMNGKFRLGIVRYPFWDTNAIESINLQHQLPQLESVLQDLRKSSSFEVIDPVAPTPGLINSVSVSREKTVFYHDFKHGINHYLTNDTKSTGQTAVKNLKEIIQFNEEHPCAEGYNQKLLTLSEATDGIDNSGYIKARDSNRANARELLDSILIKGHLDALVFPSEARHEKVGDEKFKNSPVLGFSLAAIAGYPSLNLPAGIGLSGVPIGLTFVALPRKEMTLLQIAHQIELMHVKRNKPRFYV